MKTDNVFRFVAVRPPVLKTESPTLESHGSSASEVADLLNEKITKDNLSPHFARLAVGSELVNSESYFTALLSAQALLAGNEKAQDLLNTAADINFDDFCKAGLDLLAPINPQHKPLGEVLIGDEYMGLHQALWRSYYATVLNPHERPQDRQMIAIWLSLCYLLESEGEDQFRARARGMGKMRLSVPSSFFAEPEPPQVSLRPPIPPHKSSAPQLKKLEADVANLRHARQELAELFMTKVRSVEHLRIRQLRKVSSEPGGASDGSPNSSEMPSRRLTISTDAKLAELAPWRVTAEDRKRNSDVFRLLKGLGLPAEVAPLPDLISRLDTQIATFNATIDNLQVQQEVIPVGRTLVKVPRLPIDGTGKVLRSGSVSGKKPLIRPLGIGDLKVVKQKLARFEPGEVAHVENVMAQESRNRKHRRLHQFEEILELEQEREEESLRDLQSTERFEMASESQRTIRSEAGFQAGVSVSGGFGPVSVSAYAKFNTNTSKEESNRNSTKYAKEITEKNVSRLMEKVRQERRTRTLEEVEEINEHGFSSGEENLSGIYRWVDKYYRAKTVDYGMRLMYEFYVPEPAAFYIFATKYNLDSRVLPTKPPVPTRLDSQDLVGPGDITRENYLVYVQRYNAEGVQPPPAQSIVVTKALSREIPKAGHWAFSNEDLKIPKGYQAATGFATVDVIPGDIGMWADFLIGGSAIPLDSTTISSLAQLTFSSETGSIPISGVGFGHYGTTMHVEVNCSLTPEYEEKWKIETYSAIIAAYNKALMDYEERLAAAQISQGVAIGGDNPAINREIEQQELKRECLTMWTGRSFDDLSAIEDASPAPAPGIYPEINVAHAISNASVIEFFERAFDWRNMTYEFLPYFWGGKSRWIDLLAWENPDPIFTQFLRAGAARVVVPVNPVYAEAVLYYQLTGEIWTGGPIPSLSGSLDPEAELYNGYLEELSVVTAVPDIDQDVEILADDPTTWLIKVPTTLVWLQNDTILPNLEDHNG